MCDYPVPVNVMLAVFAGALTAILAGMCLEPREVWRLRRVVVRRLMRAWSKFMESGKERKGH